MQVRRRAEIILLLTTLFWGAAFVFVKEALLFVPPFSFAALRFLVGALAFFPFIFWMTKERQGIFFSREGFLLGLCLAMGFLLQTMALVYTSASSSAFLTSLFVILVPLLSFLIFKERLVGRSYLSLALAVAGLYLLSKGGDSEELSLNRLGDFLSLLCALAFAIQIMLVSRFTRRKNVTLLAFQQLLWCGILCFVMAFIFEGEDLARLPEALSIPEVWVSVAFCGLLATAFAFWVQCAFQKDTSEFRASLIYATEPVIATICAVLYGQEILSLQKIISFVLLSLSILASL
jgi:drug/metabolite transporter (DMT)-like permease